MREITVIPSTTRRSDIQALLSTLNAMGDGPSLLRALSHGRHDVVVSRKTLKLDIHLP